jgi:signal transduction histidine kinase
VRAEREARLSAQREDLARAERLATLGHMAARMAHEVRNPLSSIGLNAELLEEELRAGHDFDRGEARELLEAIGSEVERLRQVTEIYLTRARRVPLTRERTDLGQLVGRLVDFARSELEQRQVVVSVQSPAEAMAEIDTRMVRQALWNLVRNGWEAMPGGGHLWLEVQPRRTEVNESPVDWLVIAVQDSGEGIAEEARPRLFEPFFTTKEAGTGVGLALVAEVASAHGGRVVVATSERGSGARFELWLPVVAPPELQADD